MSSGQGGAGTRMGTSLGDPWSNEEPKTPVAEAKAAEPESVAEIEAEIEAARRKISDVAGELNRRRDRVVAVSRRWGWRVAPIAGGLVLLAAAGFGYRYWRSRRRAGGPERWMQSLRALEPRAVLDQLRTRVSNAIAPKEESHRFRDVGGRVATTALGAAASVAGKQLARRLITSNSPSRP